MPAGSKPGERRGGRTKGVPNRASIRRQEHVAATGATPLDVMLEAMRFFRGVAAQEQAKGVGTNAKLVRDNLKAAADIAKDAAQYVHPRLASTTLRGDSGKTGNALKVEVEYV